MLHLREQFDRAGVEREYCDLPAVVRDRAVGGKEAAQDGRGRKAVELVNSVGESLLRDALN